MAEVPYTPTPGSLTRFLAHIQSAGIPSRLSQQYLEGVGFKSKNDRALIPVLKALGFVDSSGVPTAKWRAYRDRSQAKAVLAQAIREGYSDLFETYPDAYRKDNEAIRNFFSSRSSLSETTLDKAVQTFRVLVTEADFAAEAPAEAFQQEPIADVGKSLQALPSLPASPTAVINVNVQLQLPETTDASVYERLFAALRKHLIDPDSGSSAS